ncbi:homocysteine-responsive endoplasmic reticulum-resident ubiquitin-like domain member 2 protein isoform X1 [Alosa pseudoharengus]|uniref:homocysteine-responsive endoplasmic reticulum-resident ubiquitin-like domain member 2 protein isoform X1 n=1 Tax=Alosa pseudoharengus TaxID=34774 RepID=UPI003F8A48E5
MLRAMDMDIPVTLVIKAPNQKYDDQTIYCFLNWTVEKLKTHISHVYPSKPSSKDQRLVYSGKLLSDDLQLKDVLRKQDEYHMLHLVCASRTPPGSPQPRRRHTKSKSHSSSNSDPRPASTESTSTAAGLSHVPGPHTGGQNQQGHLINTAAHPAFAQGHWLQFPQAASPPYGTTAPISPMSLLWWQQAYAWQLYMHQQASLAAYYQTATPIPPTGQSEQPRVEQQAAPADPIGGEGQDGEDQNRDWLDWVYTGARAIVLLSIIYFYSSFNRFVMVIGGMLLLYLHQAGWLPFNLEHELQNLADGGNQDELDGDLNDLQDMERVIDDGFGDEDGDSAEEGSEGPPGEDDQNGFFSSAWSFITTFFTSLIPEGVPNAAN